MSEEADKLLPIANIGRLMKQGLPPPAKISKEAKQTMQECATEFIGFVTGEASDKCQKENRKTVNGDDIIWALSSLGFDNHAQAITKYLKQYRDHEEEKARLKGLGFGAEGSLNRSAQEQPQENKADEEEEEGGRNPFVDFGV